MMRTTRRIVLVVVGTRRSFDTTRMRTGARDSVVNARRWSRRGSDAKRRDRWTRKTRWIAFQSALACALGCACGRLCAMGVMMMRVMMMRVMMMVCLRCA